MLVQFSVTNFLSFKDQTTLNLVASNVFKEHADSQLIPVDEDTHLLKSAVLYGANASGKSNLVKAMAFMKSFIKSSFADALKDEQEIFVQPFKLNTATENAPSSFEVTFIIDEVLYRYGFTASRSAIQREYLYRTIERETRLFERDFQRIQINKASFGEGKGLENKARQNVLFLSLVAQLNGSISNTVLKWFNSINAISGTQDQLYKQYTIQKLKTDAAFRKWTNQWMDFLEIERVTTETAEVSLKPSPTDDEDLKQLLLTIAEKRKSQKQDLLTTWHRKYDEHNLLVDTIPFLLHREESEGTKKFLYLLGPLYDTIINNKILFIDEFDSKFHTLLTKRLIDFFGRQTPSTGQLIAILHDTNLLDSTLLRRDQIWFIEKDQYGASQLYSLADYKSARVKGATAFEKQYIAGRYGAIPYFSDSPLFADSMLVADGQEK